MTNDLTYKSLVNREKIRQRAEDFWDEKTNEMKKKLSFKYRHLFKDEPNWEVSFNELNKKQQSIIVKGELIRTYDNLPNSDKTKIKHDYHLSIFSSKWYKLPKQDKVKLLKKLL